MGTKERIAWALVALSGVSLALYALSQPPAKPRPDPAVQELRARVVVLADRVGTLEMTAASLRTDVTYFEVRLLALDRRIRALERVVPVQAIRDRAGKGAR